MPLFGNSAQDNFDFVSQQITNHLDMESYKTLYENYCKEIMNRIKETPEILEMFSNIHEETVTLLDLALLYRFPYSFDMITTKNVNLRASRMRRSGERYKNIFTPLELVLRSLSKEHMESSTNNRSQILITNSTDYPKSEKLDLVDERNQLIEILLEKGADVNMKSEFYTHGDAYNKDITIIWKLALSPYVDPENVKRILSKIVVRMPKLDSGRYYTEEENKQFYEQLKKEASENKYISDDFISPFENWGDKVTAIINEMPNDPDEIILDTDDNMAIKEKPRGEEGFIQKFKRITRKNRGIVSIGDDDDDAEVPTQSTTRNVYEMFGQGWTIDNDILKQIFTCIHPYPSGSKPIDMDGLQKLIRSNPYILDKQMRFTVDVKLKRKATGSTPLHRAIECQNIDYSSLTYNMNGVPPFQTRDNIALIELLATGTNVNIMGVYQDHRELTPLSMVMYSLQNIFMGQSNYSRGDCLGRKTPICNYQRPPLDNIKERNAMIVKLLDKGADVNIEDRPGDYVWTYFSEACIYPHIVKEILTRINDVTTNAYKELKESSVRFRTDHYNFNINSTRLYPKRIENITHINNQEIHYGEMIADIIDALPQYSTDILGQRVVANQQTKQVAAPGFLRRLFTRKNNKVAIDTNTDDNFDGIVTNKEGGKKKNKTRKNRPKKTAKRRRRQRK